MTENGIYENTNDLEGYNIDLTIFVKRQLWLAYNSIEEPRPGGLSEDQIYTLRDTIYSALTRWDEIEGRYAEYMG